MMEAMMNLVSPRQMNSTPVSEVIFSVIKTLFLLCVIVWPQLLDLFRNSGGRAGGWFGRADISVPDPVR